MEFDSSAVQVVERYVPSPANTVEILAVRHVKQGIEAGGFRTGHPSNYYLLLSNPNITTVVW